MEACRTVQAVRMLADRNEEQKVRTVKARTVETVKISAGKNEE
jgi:hypothetical protein